jgi:hypothetical protein
MLRWNTLVAFTLVAFVASRACAEKGQVLQTAKGWIQFTLAPDWKLTRLATKPPQATVQYSKPNPASTDSQLGATITIATFQRQWPEIDAKYNQSVSHLGGSKSVLGPWTVLRAGLRFGNQQYSTRTAYRDIADVHVIVTLGSFGLPNNDPQYDKQMDATFHSLLGSISGGTGKRK